MIKNILNFYNGKLNFKATVYFGITSINYFEMKIARSLLEIVGKCISGIRK